MFSFASKAAQSLNRVGYDTIAEQWNHARTDLKAEEVRILNILLQNATCEECVLDLGCGTGSPVGEYVLALGMRLTGVDQSENMLRIARSELPRGEWIMSSLETFKPRGKYSAAIAWDSLFHIPRRQHYKIFRRVQEVLVPKGRFMLTVGGSEHPAFTGTMFGCPLFFDSNSPRVTVGLLKRAGFKIIYTEFLDVPTNGPDKGRFAVVAES